MSEYSRIRRQQLVREAEGYLELAGMFADRWPLPRDLRDRLAQRALDTLQRTTGSGGSRAHVQFLMGQALRLMERFSDAIAPLVRASSLEPENIAIWLALGWCYKRVDRLDLAIDALEQALAADDQEAILHYNLACYLSLTQNVAPALAHLSQAFELDATYRERVAAETDFDPIRNDPHFRALMSSVIV
ncbi:MAG: hypothetical protein U0935_20235 [Pirellulales bacterium]